MGPVPAIRSSGFHKSPATDGSWSRSEDLAYSRVAIWGFAFAQPCAQPFYRRGRNNLGQCISESSKPFRCGCFPHHCLTGTSVRPPSNCHRELKGWVQVFRLTLARDAPFLENPSLCGLKGSISVLYVLNTGLLYSGSLA